MAGRRDVLNSHIRRWLSKCSGSTEITCTPCMFLQPAPGRVSPSCPATGTFGTAASQWAFPRCLAALILTCTARRFEPTAFGGPYPSCLPAGTWTAGQLGGGWPGFPISVAAAHWFEAADGDNDAYTTWGVGLAGFGTTIFPLLFVSFNFWQLFLTSFTNASSISSKPCISLAATAEPIKLQAGCKFFMTVYIGMKSASGKSWANHSCWHKAPCDHLIFCTVSPLCVHFLLSLNLCEAHFLFMSTDGLTAWVGAIHADCLLKSTRQKLNCPSRPKDSGIVQEYAPLPHILHYVPWGFVYI